MTDGRAAGITGASGFVGSALCRAFRADGVPVVAFTRDAARVSAAGVEARPYAISDVPELAGIGVLVHCAIATEGEHDDVVRRNVDGALALYRAASRAGIRFVFVSSLSAEGEASSAYAEQKRRIESLLGGDALIVRPGLIAGAGGLFQRLRATASRPVVPLIDGGRQTVQIVAIDDVCSAVRVALDARLAGAHNVVAPPPLTLRDVVVALAPRRALLIDVPSRIVVPAVALLERLGVRLPVSSGNLRGLRSTIVHAASDELVRRGWSPAPALTVLASFSAKGLG